MIRPKADIPSYLFRFLTRMGDSMKATLRLLGATALVSCLGSLAFAGAPTTPAQPTTMSAISGKMTVVAGDLAKTVTGEPVQKEQKVILRDLDDLIAELEKQCAACRGGIKRNNPNRGLPDSIISRGTGGIGDLVAPGQSEKDW